MEIEKSIVYKKHMEAKFFFQKMEISTFDEDQYEFYLSAFINAARNITFAMQKERGDIKEFANWYVKTQEQLKNNNVCHFFSELRTYSIHEGTNKINGDVSGIHMRHRLEFDGEGNCVIHIKSRGGDIIGNIKIDLQQFKDRESQLNINGISYEYLLEKGLIERRYYFDKIDNVDLERIDVATINDLSYDYISFIEPFVKEYLNTFIK